MGFSKKSLHHREPISGLHVHDDITTGEHGAMDLAKRNQARQDDLNAKNRADWPANMTASIPEHTDPSFGNAFSRMPKPSDFVVGSKAPRFGASAEDDTNPAVQGGQPQKTAKVAGVERPKKRG